MLNSASAEHQSAPFQKNGKLFFPFMLEDGSGSGVKTTYFAVLSELFLKLGSEFQISFDSKINLANLTDSSLERTTNGWIIKTDTTNSDSFIAVYSNGDEGIIADHYYNNDCIHSTYMHTDEMFCISDQMDCLFDSSGAINKSKLDTLSSLKPDEEAVTFGGKVLSLAEMKTAMELTQSSKSIHSTKVTVSELALFLADEW